MAIRMAKSPRAASQARPLLNLDLKIFALTGLYLVLFVSPFFRGLYFESESLPVLAAVSVIFSLAVFDKLIHGENQIYGGSRALLAGPLDLAVLGLAAAYGISLATAADFRTALSEFLRNAAYFMAYLTAAQLLSNPAGRRRLMQVIFLAAVGVAVVGLASALGLFKFPGGYVSGRINSTFQYPNTMAAFLMAGSLLGTGLWAGAVHSAGRAVYPVGLALINLAIIGSLSRGVWVVYPVFFLVLLAGLRREDRPRILFGQLTLLTGALIVSRLLWTRAGAGGSPALKGLAWIALAGLAALAAESLYGLAAGWIRRQDWPRPVVQALGLMAAVYVLAAGGYYFWYASQALPSGLDQVVPDPVQSRAEAIAPNEASFTGRLEYYRDALRIYRDYPLARMLAGGGGGAWEALYHQQQNKLYWSSDVHSHFLKTLLEAGPLGLASLLATAAWLIRRNLIRLAGVSEDDPEGPAAHAIAAAALAILVHSAVDFNLSMPAVAITLWALAGSISRTAADTADLPGSEKRGGSLRALGLAAGAAGLALLVAVPSVSFYRAGAFGAQGARAILDGDYPAAESYLETARRLDPYSASYSFDLSQIYTARAIAAGDSASRERAREMAAEAARQQPYNLVVAMGLVDMYLWQGRLDDAARAGGHLVEIFPSGITSYERSARARVLAARAHLAATGDRIRAGQHITAALELEGKIAGRSAKTAGSKKRHSGQPLSITPALKLSFGQAEYLGRSFDAAAKRLEPLSKDQNLGPEAALWAAAAHEKSGRPERAGPLLGLALKGDPEAAAEYSQIIALAGE